MTFIQSTELFLMRVSFVQIVYPTAMHCMAAWWSKIRFTSTFFSQLPQDQHSNDPWPYKNDFNTQEEHCTIFDACTGHCNCKIDMRLNRI